MRLALALAVLLLAGCVSSPPAADRVAGNGSSGTGQERLPVSDGPTVVKEKQDHCAGTPHLVDQRSFLAAALSGFAADADVFRCGRAEVVLNGTLSGEVTISWTGGAGGQGGCPSVTVVAPAVLTCYEEGLPRGRVLLTGNLTGAGTADVHFLDYS